MTELLLSVGGVVGAFELTGASPAFIAAVVERYGPYCVPAAPWARRDFSLQVSFSSLAGGPGIVLTPGGDGPPLDIDEGASRMTVRRWDFAASLEERHHGRARGHGTTFRGHATCDTTPFALDSLMRVLWSIFLPRAGGALLHACGLRFGEHAVVFPGESGAGKSTLARKMPDPSHILTDEIVAVVPTSGGWRVTGTPFWGEFKRGGGSVRSWPLAAVAFLAQANDVGLRPLTGGEAAFRLLGCFLCFQTDTRTATRNLALATQICKDVQAQVLSSTRETPMAAIEAALRPRFSRGHGATTRPTSRELISELRWMLQSHGQYAYRPRGSSMRPWLRTGDTLFVKTVREEELVPGDLVLYWTPGRTPDEDRLTCHRLVSQRRHTHPRWRPSARKNTQYLMKGDTHSAVERFENGRESEILGLVTSIGRDNQTSAVPSRMGNLVRLAGSLAAVPLLLLAGR